jgi:hypothetical protein
MELKAFMAAYLAMIIGVPALVIIVVPKFQTENEILPSPQHHFSVRWMGYVPTYSNQTPDYYICINNLASDPMTLQIALQIKNQENQSFYFKMDQNQAPPSGWSVPPYTIGLINKDQTLAFTYSASRTNPGSISQGRLTETINLIVKAYYDSLYTQFYSSDSFPVTFNFLDRTATVWANLYYDNFDDGGIHQWSGLGAAATTDYYRSFQFSLKFQTGYGVNYGASKSFDISGSFTEAYLIFAVRSGAWSSPGINLNGVCVYQPDVAPSANTWYQFAIKLPTAQITQVNIYPKIDTGYVYAYIDDTYVIAR